jgi:FkbM family methyltransferase
MDIKHIFRKTLNFLRLDVTKNLEYDRLTHDVLKQVLLPSSNCIDVGCHKGEILASIIKHAPNGQHFAFEPIPEMYTELQDKFSNRATILPFALSDTSGTALFNHVTNAPAYSGLQQRDYAVATPVIKQLTVEVKQLDAMIPENVIIDFMKIDVEGAEFGVLKGATRILSQDGPVLLFECGLGASNHYGTEPEDIFNYLTEMGYGVFLLKDYIQQKQPLSEEAFVAIYHANKEYYFLGTKLT